APGTNAPRSLLALPSLPSLEHLLCPFVERALALDHLLDRTRRGEEEVERGRRARLGSAQRLRREGRAHARRLRGQAIQQATPWLVRSFASRRATLLEPANEARKAPARLTQAAQEDVVESVGCHAEIGVGNASDSAMQRAQEEAIEAVARLVRIRHREGAAH